MLLKTRRTWEDQQKLEIFHFLIVKDHLGDWSLEKAVVSD